MWVGPNLSIADRKRRFRVGHSRMCSTTESAGRGVCSIEEPAALAMLDVVAGAMPGDPYFAPPPHMGSFAAAATIEPVLLRIGFVAASPLQLAGNIAPM